MKVLGALGVLFLLCVVCCGVLGLVISPSSSTSMTQATSSANGTNGAGSSTAATPRVNSRRPSTPEVARIFAKRNSEYEAARAAWQAAHNSLADAKKELGIVEAEIAEHQEEKPEPPQYREREWTTVDKKYRTVGTLLQTDNVHAKLRKPDGTEIVVPKAELIARDRVYIDDAFIASTAVQEALKIWRERESQLASRLAQIQERIKTGLAPPPVAPKLGDVEAEVAAAEAKRLREERLAKAEAEAIRQAEAERRAKDELNTYAAVLRIADPDSNLVSRVSSKGDELIVTVSNAWHYQPHQIRLQAAQNLWEGWARLHSPSEPDTARLSLVDFNGNKVGGSRVWAGSLIWVQEQ